MPGPRPGIRLPRDRPDRYDASVSEPLRVERSGPGGSVARVTLARPDVHNAFDPAVIAESGTRFGFTETRIGVVPSVITPFVVAKIGETNARALFPSGRRFDALRAQRIGLVHEVVEGTAALDASVDAAIADLMAAGPKAARAAKAIVREVRGLPHESAKWHTARVIATMRQDEEAQEGLRAFLEKRPPAWVPGED